MRRFVLRASVPKSVRFASTGLTPYECTDVLAGHALGILGVPAAASVMGTPIGTLALVALAYNVSVSGASHVQYSLDILARDYLQDTVLYNSMRYLVVLALICLVAHLLIEA